MTASDPFRGASRLVLGGVFILAALSKVGDAAPARTVVAYLLPQGPDSLDVAAALVALLAGFEAALGTALVLRRSAAAWVAVGALLVFSAVLVRLLLDEDAPGCGCLGGARLTGSSNPETWLGLIRNAALLGCASALLARQQPPASVRPTQHSAAHGFTLLETLVCIAVLAVLISIALPALRMARYQGKLTTVYSSLRQLSIASTMYSDGQRGFLPYLGVPGRPDLPLAVGGRPLTQSLYFQQSRYYVNLLYPDYYNDQSSLHRRPDASPDGPIMSRFDLTNCAFAAPGYWVGDAPPDDLSLYRGQRLADVAFPSRKGLLLDLLTGVLAPDAPVRFPGPISVGLADGSAGSRPYDASSAARTVTRPYGSAPWPVMATRGGFDGWDFE